MATLSRSSMLTFVVSRTRLGDSLFNLVQFSGLINHPFSAGPFAREQRQHLSSREHIRGELKPIVFSPSFSEILWICYFRLKPNPGMSVLTRGSKKGNYQVIHM